MTERQEPARTGELDEFITRAVDRQIAEQRSLREHLAALTDAVNALGESADAEAVVDTADLVHSVRDATRSAVDPIVSEMRVLADSVAASAQRGAPQEQGAQHSDDLTALRGSMNSLSADIDGIAQALIDLNAGLRDWAAGVDRNIAGIRETVEQVKEVATVAQEIQVAALDDTQGQRAIVLDDVADTEIVVDDRSEIEKRLKESIELSLYLADQIEEFDRVLRGMGDLPKRLEGVVAQGVRRTLTARAKLDSEAATILDDAVASLDEYNERISGAVSGFADSQETLRKLGLGQVELASRLDSLYEAVHEIAAGRGGAAARITAPKPKRRAPRAKPKPKPTSKAKKATTKRVSRGKAASQPSDDASTD
jgi:uncharacterized phage infection (PIP) family protein YhgE